MLDKTLKIAGILACVTIIFIGISVAYEVISRVIRTNSYSALSIQKNQLIQSPLQQSIKLIQIDIVKTHRNEDRLIMLLSVNNSSSQNVPLHGLDIDVVDKAGQIIDKCTQGRNTADEFVNAKQKKTIKIICTHMTFLQQYQGEVSYIPSVSRYNF